MNKIRVKSEKAYIIEVNDEGDTIEFDFTDPGLPLRLLDCYDKLEKLEKRINNEKQLINNKEDKKINELVTENQKKTMELNNQYYKEAREIIDLFIGKGSCQKIFGEKNWADMFEDLFKSLAPEFEKMGISFKNMQKRIADKYKNDDIEILG